MDAEHWIPYFILIFFSPGHKLLQVILLSPTEGEARSALSTTSLLLQSWRTCFPRPASLLKGFPAILCVAVALHSSMPVEEVSSKFSPLEIGSLIHGLNIFISLWSRGSCHRSWCHQVYPMMTRTTPLPLLSNFPPLLLPIMTPQTTFWLLANVSPPVLINKRTLSERPNMLPDSSCM